MIQVFSGSEAGGKAENQDAFEVRPLGQGGSASVGAVADGQGGRAGGAAAARLACKTCLDAASRHAPTQLLQPDAWYRSLQAADEAVAADRAAGFTTLIGLCLTRDFLCGGSCGDSAAVLLNAGQPAVILTERQPKDPPVGTGVAAFAIFRASLTRPWTVLLLSDGAWKYAAWENVFRVAALPRADKIPASLRDQVRLPGSGGLQDDFTAVVFRDDGA